jgi:rRNA-processing protein FCF1
MGAKRAHKADFGCPHGGCKMPDCCVLAIAATHKTTVATFDAQLRRHADGDLS